MGVEELEPGRYDDRRDLTLQLYPERAVVADRLRPTGIVAPGAREEDRIIVDALLDVQEVRPGDRLRERGVDRLPRGQPLVEGVGEHDRTGLDAKVAAGARAADEVPLLTDRDLVPFPLLLEAHDVRVGDDLDVTVLRDLAQLRGLDADAAVERREVLVEPRHDTTERVGLFDEHHSAARFGQVERRLDAGDAAADHHDGSRAHSRAPASKAFMFSSRVDALTVSRSAASIASRGTIWEAFVNAPSITTFATMRRPRPSAVRVNGSWCAF